VINSEEFQADQEKFAAQCVKLYMRSLGRDSHAGELAFDQEKALQAKLLTVELDSSRCPPHVVRHHLRPSDDCGSRDRCLLSFKFALIALYPTLCWLDVSSLLCVPPLLVG